MTMYPWELADPYEGAPKLAQCDGSHSDGRACREYEETEGEFQTCMDCDETLCPTHWADGDEAPGPDTCSGCMERRRDRAGDRQAAERYNS